jgi:hypothetical protein
MRGASAVQVTKSAGVRCRQSVRLKKEKNIDLAATKPPPWAPDDVNGPLDRLYDYVEAQGAPNTRRSRPNCSFSFR